MEKTLIFSSASEVKPGKLLRFIIPTYLTSLFNTLYTMVDGIFVSSYVGTNALAAINIVYPIVNVLTGIALIFGTGGSAVAALLIGAQKRAEANRAFSISVLASLFLGCLVSLLMIGNLEGILHFLGATEITMNDCRAYALWWLFGTPLVICKELFTYFIRVDGSPTYSFLTALSGGICNIVLDYILVAQYGLGIHGAAAATILGLLVSTCMGIVYFCFQKKLLSFTIRGLKLLLGGRCMVNGVSEFVNQLAIAITTIVFNRTAMTFAGEDGIAAVSIIMYLQYLVIGVYFGVSMGMAPPLGYAYGEENRSVCRALERYAYRFFLGSPLPLYGATFFFAPLGVHFFADTGSPVYTLAVTGMRLYGMGFLFSGINIFSAIRFMAYGKGHLSGIITFLRSFALLLLFLLTLPDFWGIRGVWLAVPFAEGCTILISALLTGMEARKVRPCPASDPKSTT